MYHHKVGLLFEMNCERVGRICLAKLTKKNTKKQSGVFLLRCKAIHTTIHFRERCRASDSESRGSRFDPHIVDRDVKPQYKQNNSFHNMYCVILI